MPELRFSGSTVIVVVPQPVIFGLVAMSNVSTGVPLLFLMTSVPVPGSTALLNVMVRLVLVAAVDDPSVGETVERSGMTAVAGDDSTVIAAIDITRERDSKAGKSERRRLIGEETTPKSGVSSPQPNSTRVYGLNWVISGNR